MIAISLHRFSPFRFWTVVITTSIMAHGTAAAQTTAPPTRTYTTQELFSALVFGTGPAAPLFPEISRGKRTAPQRRSNSAEAKSVDDAATVLRSGEIIDDRGKAKLTEFSRDIAAGRGTKRSPVPAQKLADFAYTRISAEDPAFFDRFRAEITSGDQRRVQEAMTEVSKRLTKVLLPESQPIPDIEGIAVNVDSVINVETAVNVHFAYNVDTVKNITHYWPLQSAPQADRLRNETIINSVTAKLARLK